MRGSLWTIVVAAIGAAVVLRGVGGSALPSSPASSTNGVHDVLTVTTPFIGQLLLLAGIGAIVLMAIRAT